jgi:GMP synthase-like glutamine amidotransferase
VNSSNRVLVLENDPSDDARLFGDWLTGAGVAWDTLRAHAGEPVPADLSGYGGLVVLGGAQDAYDAPDGTPGAPWFPAVKSLLRVARRDRVPTLGICLGAQLIAEAFGGVVEPGEAGFEIGPRLVGKRDAAERDPLFAPVPFTPDVLQWHLDDITELPPDAVLLAGSPRHAHQAFRLGDRMWGVQFHIECDLAMITDWADEDPARLAALGHDRETLLARTEAVLPDVAEVWRPFTERFAALVGGRVGGTLLPIVDG